MFGSSSTSTTDSGNNKHDPIIGLDVGGQLYYFHLSKLMKSGSTYFVNRLEGRLDAEVAYKDERGREVIFIDRSPTRFDFIRDYLVTLQLRLPSSIPSSTTASATDTTTDLTLRRNLREEAEFFGLTGLSQLLQVSQTFSPQTTNRGVLYWLGTERGRAIEYTNPYTMGVVNVTGWMDDDANEEEDMFELARFARSRETFIHYRLQPEVASIKSGGNITDWEIEQFSCLQWCKHANKRLPVVIDLKAVQLRPTHYSLRVSECMGMAGDWNFEASNDGTTWDVLHKARNDDHLCLEEGNEEIKNQLTKTLSFYNDHVQDDELGGEILLTILEQDFRHTWELDPRPTKFYRYFRFIGASKLKKEDEEEEDEDEEEEEGGCLHGEGLELFGDVYEE